MLRLLITAIVCLFASHCGADEILGTNPKMTLRPPAPKPAPVLGIPFGSSFQDANIALTRLGLKLVGRETLDDNGKAHLLTFDHLPESLLAGTGKLQILFYDNRLIRAKFDFDPTYHNFLLTRERLIAQLGDRYSVEKEELFRIYVFKIICS